MTTYRRAPARAALLLLASTLAVPALPAQTSSPAAAGEDPRLAEFAAFAEAYIEAAGIPGLSVAVMEGETVWSRGFGYADLENQTPAKPESAYRLASVTKPMTAVAVLELAEEGLLDLDAEIQTYVPYFPRKEHPITARQLLGHLGGISHYRNYDIEGHFKDHKTTEESIAVFADFDLVAEPGTRYSYTSYGYNLLGAAVEGASGMSYGDYMSRKVWGPMGMEDTRMEDPYELIPHRVRGYRMNNGRLENSEFVDISSRFAAGGTRSTVLDLIDFVRGLDAHKVLTPASTELMFTSLATADGRFTDYGCGWSVTPVNGRPRVTHTGGQAETRTQLTWFPGDDFAIAMASNLEGADFQPLHEKLMRLFYDETWNVLAFLPDERERAVYYAMASAFRRGVADRKLRGGDPERTPEVAAAFARFRDATSAAAYARDPEGTLATLRSGRHPAGDEVWVTMGSHMAAVLTNGDAAAYDKLHHGGALAFFQAWVDHGRAHRREVPRKLRFPAELEKTIAGWSADWKAVWTPELRDVILTEGLDVGALGETMRTAFAGRTLVPDYSPELITFAEDAFQRGANQEGLGWSQLAIDLYPEAENANGLWGVVMLTGGDGETGMRHLRKSAAIDPNGYAGVSNLMQIAGFFESIGVMPIARALLSAAVELHPESEDAREALAALGS